MKVLIDENLPRKLAGHLKGHECRTVAECGWAGKKNGELLSLAELLPVIPDCLAALQNIEPGHVVRVGNPPTR